MNWKSIKTNPPKCGQIVLGKLKYSSVEIALALVYVVKYKGKRRYGFANSYCVDFSGESHQVEFDQRQAEESFPCDDRIVEWMDPKELL